MHKLVATTLAVALVAASATAFADTGNAFVDANVGSSNYNISAPPAASGHTSYQGMYSPAGALRVGYRWSSVVDYGFEAGYGYLGQANGKVYDGNGDGVRTTQKDRGWLLGGNLKYNINEHWYVSARAGWFRDRALYTVDSIPASGYPLRASYINTGEYFGLGAGYNINKSFSLGLAYDSYRAPGGPVRSSDPYTNGTLVKSTRIGQYSIQAEYRF